MLRKLASGGMAEVYLARQSGIVGFEKLVVIKRILPHLAERAGFVQMFLDEARTAADLRHPNVVNVLDIGEDRGTFFIAMEYLQGQHLRRVEQTAKTAGGLIPLDIVLRIVLDAAHGLHYAHRKSDLRGSPIGIVHRDVSPHNIVVTYDGATKIVDFGIAKARNQMTDTAPGVVKGKVAYLSPEQASGEPLDARSDLFSLAVVLYELSTGMRLFVRDTEVATIAAVLDGTVPPPGEVQAGYPPSLEKIVLKALSANPEDRYDDCAGFGGALRGYMETNSVTTSPQEVGEYMTSLFEDVKNAEEADLAAALDEGSVTETGDLSPSSVNAPSWQSLGTEGTGLTREESRTIAPRGLVTLVFTDIEGSTSLWERQSEAMEEALRLHNELLRDRLRLLGGYEVKTEGDSFMAAFNNALDAVKWCLQVQIDLTALEWPEALLQHDLASTIKADDGTVLHRGPRVRMGVHIGRPACQPNPVTGRMDYFGPTVNRAARVCDAAHGGQVLVTSWVLREVEHKLETSLQNPVLHDLGEHRLKGLDTALHIAQLLPGVLAKRTFPKLRTLETRKTNLTLQPARFVGRTADLAALKDLLGTRAERLVTLLGTGGTGKTRLSQEYGWTHLSDYTEGAGGGGVWFFDLTDARTIDGICSTVGSVLAVPLTSGKTTQDIVEQLGHAMAGRGRALMILDNFEQVVDFGPDTLGKWLQLAPESQFLVTSQATLKLPGEAFHELAPLTLPEGDEPDIHASEAVQLFVQRARAARPNFELTESDASVVADIVRQLDGLPLAIELAAARIKVFSPTKLRDRLSRRFDLLKGARRDVTDRQATLRGAIEWSWKMLNPWEQVALAQCSVFRGGFTLEAAEEVLDLSAHPEAPWELDVVQTLRERSLLRTYEPSDAAGELRFSMYESIREFSAEKLAGLGDTSVADAQARHAQFYLDTCGAWAESIETASSVERLEELQLEVDNLLAVHERALAEQPPNPAAAERAMLATLALNPVMAARGPFGLHLRVLDDTVQYSTNAEPDGDLVCRVLIQRGRARRARGQLAESQADFEQALLRAQELGNRQLEGVVRGYLGTVHQYQGRYEEALTQYQLALECLRNVGDLRYKGIVMGSLGVYHHEQGRVDQARMMYEQALNLLRQIGDRTSEAVYVGNLGMVHHEAGRLDDAQRDYEQALEIHRELGSRRAEGMVLGYLATLHQDATRMLEAAEQYQKALSVLREVGDRRLQGMYLGYYGTLLHSQGQLDDAVEHYRESVEILGDIGNRRFEGLFLGFAGAADADAGRTDAAAEKLGRAQAILEEVGDALLLECVRIQHGHLDLALGRRDEAEIRTTAARTPGPEGASPEDRSADVRFALRLLEVRLQSQATR